MALENQNSNPAIRIIFDGLNTHVSELFIPGFNSPDLLNVDLDPISTMRKRDGILWVSAVVPNGNSSGVPLNGGGQMCKWLYRMSQKESYLYLMRGSQISKYDLYSPPVDDRTDLIYCPWHDAFMPTGSQAAFTDESANVSNEALWVYRGECLYLADKLNEPVILSGGDVTPSADLGSVIYSVDPSGDVIGTCTGHGMSHGDVIQFPWDLGTNDFDDFESKHYYAEPIDLNTFYLRDGGLIRQTGTVGWTPTPGPDQLNTYTGGFERWPMGEYHATTPVRGYPVRWIDPDSDGVTADGWPVGTPDWPSHVSFIGQGLGARMFAYGFDGDPDRIDYSQLGVPYNFLKADPFAATEADALTNPSEDGGYFYAMRGDGDRVVSVRELRGLIVVFKTRRTVIWTGEIGEYFRIAQEIPVGAVNDASVVNVGNDIYFWSFDGPRRLTPALNAADLMEGSISAEIIEVVNRISRSNNRKVEARHERRKQRIVWHFPTIGGDENSQCLVYYYPTNADPEGRWSLWSGPYCSMAQTVAMEDPDTGATAEYGQSSSDGCLYQLNVGSNDGASLDSSDDPESSPTYVPIGMRYVTKWFDFESVDTFKRPLTLLAIFGEGGQGGVKFAMGIDYESGFLDLKHRLTEEGAAGTERIAFWNDGLWSGDPGTGFLQNGYWNDSGRAMVTYEAEGNGRVFRFSITDSSTNPCSISGIVFGPSRKGTR